MADPVGSFQGLATGINFRDLVDQIVVAESRPQRLLESRILDLKRRQGAMDGVRNLLTGIEDTAAKLGQGTSFDGILTSVQGLGDNEQNPFSISTTGDAAPGSHQVSVLQLAASERLGGGIVSSKTTALGFSGEFLVGGQVVSIATTDTLNQIVDSINSVNSGTSASRVSASIITTGTDEHRLVLGSDDTGAAGIDLVDGTGGVLRSLGLIETTTTLKSGTSDGAKSDGFVSSVTTVGSMLGFAVPPASGAVTIGGLSVTIDLSADTLTAIASAINTEATAQSSSITAVVIQEEDASGTTLSRLDISGTTSFTDTNRILESLGVLSGTRGAVTQQVQAGNAFTDGDAVTVATAATTLANVWVGGSDAGTIANDTIVFAGTRGDGTTFTKTFTAGGADTLQTVLDALNAVDAFGGGGQTATASISNGRLVVTDGTAGESRLDLQITSNNQGGGTLDFGTTTVATAGRDRVLVAGVDAQVEIDGAFITDSDNAISDVLEGVTFDLTTVRVSPLTVSFARDVDTTAADIVAFVAAVNKFEDFAFSQMSGLGAEEGSVVPALSGSALLRQIRTQVRDTMNSTLTGDVSGTYRRLADLGIEIGSDGRYDVDEVAVKSALNTNFSDVEGFFSAFGTSDTSSIEYVASTSDTQAGTYQLIVTQVASKAATTGVGFGATYVDDATADTLSVRDVGTNSTYSISLTNGDTLQQIIDGLNTQFTSATIHQLKASNTVYSDAIGTVAAESTKLDSLFDSGGTNYGVATGDLITLSGTGPNGTSVFREIAVTDPSTQSLGDIKAEIESELNAEVNVSVVNGVVTFTAKDAGLNTMALTLSSDNAGGGTLTFGTLDVATVGRGTVAITASDSGGQLKLEHGTYGSVEGFEVTYTAGGTDGSASLGVGAATYSGVDVAGTLGGLATTGFGDLLTGADDTAVEGLVVRYSKTGTGSIGDLTFSRGIGSLMELLTEPLLGSEAGSIDDLVDGLDDQIETINDRIDGLDDRMGRRRVSLIQRFSALEEAMAKANAQAQFFLSALGSLGGGSGS